MYSRKENTMANKHDSFNMDKFQSKEKKEKPIKEKKEKDSSFDMGGGFSFKSRSDSFNTDKFKTREKKEKPFKEIKEKSSSFDVGGGFRAKFKSDSFDTEKGKREKPIKDFSFKQGDASFLDENGRPKNLKAVIVVAVAVVLAIILIVTLTTGLAQQQQYDEEIVRISIETYPENTEFYVGEKIDITGLTIKVTTNNDKTYIIDGAACQISGYDNSKPVETQKVTVEYQGFSCTFNVKIKKIPKPTPTLVSIYLETMPKTEYKVGDKLNTDGGVLVLCYDDGSDYRMALLNKYVSGFKAVTGHGTYNLTVEFEDEIHSVLVYTTYTITVTE